MLILMRRCEESVVIGDNIEVKVLRIQGNQVHLGIKAPRDVSVYRREIWEQTVEESGQADQPQSGPGPKDADLPKKRRRKKKP